MRKMNKIYGASSFNGDVSRWNIAHSCRIDYMFRSCQISEIKRDLLFLMMKDNNLQKKKK